MICASDAPRPRLAAWAIGVLVASCADRVAAADSGVECEILYEAPDGIYVDAGTDEGLVKGRVGTMRLAGEQVTRFEVTKIGRGSAFLKTLWKREDFAPTGEEIVFLVIETTPPSGRDPPRERGPSLKDPNGKEEFTPLLAPYGLGALAKVDPRNVSVGRVGIRQLFQIGSDNYDYWRTQLTSSGSVERLDGTPWAFEWHGVVSYRGGDGLSQVRDYEEVRLEMYRFAFYRRFDDRSFVRFGRFVPLELPSVGFIDGAQAEEVIWDKLRVGTIFGLKPQRDRNLPSIDEFAAVPYVSGEFGDEKDLFYSATLGVLGSFYRGTPDRLAILADQRMRIRDLSIFASSEVDFDIGASEKSSGTRLTRMDLLFTYPVGDAVTLRGGVDRHGLPDSEAERQAISKGSLLVGEFFNDGFWRYWGGASWRLPRQFRVDGELGLIDGDSNDAFRWNVRFSRQGIPWFPNGSATLSVYNLDGFHSNGIGVRLSGMIPAYEGRLFVQPAIALRVARYDTDGAHGTFFEPVDQTVGAVDLSLRAQYRMSRSWSFAGGMSYALGEDENRFFLDIGATYRW